jgi:hypothetical protein
VSRRSWDGITEPDADGGDVYGSAGDEVALVIPGSDRPVLAEPAEGAFDGVALLVSPGAGGGRAPLRPRRRRLRAWPAGSGMVAVIRRRRRWERIALLEYALPASRRPGLARGRPRPRRAIFSRFISGMNASEPWRCPALVTRTSGRQDVPASR